MSEIGSVIRLPTGFRDARDQPVQSCFAELEARAGELAQITMAPPADRTAIDYASRAGVAGQLRNRRIILLRLQFSAQGGVLLDCFPFFLVPFKPSLFSHKK